MPDVVIENPIINSPFEEPMRHFYFGETGITDKIVESRRNSAYFVPIPPSRKKSGKEQLVLGTEWTKDRQQENKFINDIRNTVAKWRFGGYDGVTSTTRTLLEYWKRPDRERKLFFCQIEALETAIYFAELSTRRDSWIRTELKAANDMANPLLNRVAFKMATGTGKTVVMARGVPLTNIWSDLGGAVDPIYVMQTTAKIVERCMLMCTDPGDLVLDPTCGSGTTAYVAEQWGRRWITTDTSRVALALARTRIMSARYPYYLLSDSTEGIKKESAVIGKPPTATNPQNDIKKGFVYKRVPHITLKSIANNEEIDTIHAAYEAQLDPIREKLNAALKKHWQEWEIPREPDAKWPAAALALHAEWWKVCLARQKEIDASIARRADTEFLFDQPYEDNKRIRVSGPFTVESLSPHRILKADEERPANEAEGVREAEGDFVTRILAYLKKSGVQNTVKQERLMLDPLEPYPGEWIQAAGEYRAPDGKVQRVAVTIGPQYGTVGPDLVKEAAKEAVRGVGFDLLIVCGFALDPHVSEETRRYGKLTVLTPRMNPDLLMGDGLLKKTGAANLFMVFGEPNLENAPGQPATSRATRCRRLRSHHPGDPQQLHRRSGMLVHRHQLQRRKLLRPPRILHRSRPALRAPAQSPESRSRRNGMGESVLNDKESLRSAIDATPVETYPEPVSHCDVCLWWKECDSRRRADDHLSFVAGASKLQRKELMTRGVSTLEALAILPLPLPFKPARGATDSYVRIREQARIQLEARIEAHLKFESLRTEPGEGLARLPAPSPGDIFLDFEGDPFVGEGGLEYLTGFITGDGRGALSYECRWALNRAEEKTAFEWLIDFTFERLARFPGLHIYHYASYEPSAIKRLMLRYATREEEVDRLLRGEVFVDLHVVIKQGIRASVEQYSLKELEKFCEYRRAIPLLEANQARHFIEHQLELSPTPELTAEACKVVVGYNEDDCRATEQVRNWLEKIHAEMIANGADLPRPQVKETAPSAEASELQLRIAALFEALTRDLPPEPADRNLEHAARWLLAHALAWHSREDKVKWWEFFRMKDLAEDDLYDHKEVLTELTLVARMPKMKPKERSPIDRYRYPA